VSRGLYIDAVACRLRAAMNSEMLGRSNRLEILGIITLQTGYECNSHSGSEIGIFTVCLLSASPARIAEDVDIGSPDRKAAIPISITVGVPIVVVLGPELCADHVCDAMH